MTSPPKVHKWSVSKSLPFVEAWRLAIRLAQKLLPEFDAPEQNPPRWDNRREIGICDVDCDLTTAHGPHGWRVTLSESYSGPAETHCVTSAAFTARGLPGGRRLSLEVTSTEGGTVSECSLRVSGLAREVEGVLEVARSLEAP